MNCSKTSCCAWFHKHGLGAGLLVLRLAMAFILIWSGYTKIFGGMEMFTGAVAGLGFPAPAVFAWLAALAEFLGGISLLLGAMTRVFSALVAITMIVALVGVTRGNLMMSMSPLMILAGSVTIFLTGAGPWSVCCWNKRKCGVACGCCQGEACGMNMADAGCCQGGGKDGCCKEPKTEKGKK